MSGKLYLVATPIGNLEDITLRALRILKEVDVIAAEDTRHTLKLLNHYEIKKSLISYHRHNEEVKTEVIINRLLNNENVALVTDAGTPIISDPGEEVVKEAIKQKIEIIPIPGACALVNAIIPSGISAKAFAFYGFLPQNKKNRKNKLEEIKEENKTIILYEAPHKIKSTIEEIYEFIGDRKICLAKEITKIHETFLRTTLKELIENNFEPKGEYIIVLEGTNIDKKEEEKKQLAELSIEEHYKYYEKKGLTKNEIIKNIAKDRKVSKNEIYMQFV